MRKTSRLNQKMRRILRAPLLRKKRRLISLPKKPVN
jgi:hypothetical protein